MCSELSVPPISQLGSFDKALSALLTLYCACLSAGGMDHIPEVAFYMVGNLEEVVQKAEKLAEEQN